GWTCARPHWANVARRGAIEAVRRAKNKGLPVTCEVPPHHWSLTDEAVQDYDTNTKMSPPLRSRDHLEAILAGLRDGTIDAIATDHAPHHADEKELEYDQAPFGIVGLETSVGLAMERLVKDGVISLERRVELCAAIPARILNLEDRGTFRANAWADVTIIDPQMTWTFDVTRSKSKSRNTPFDGYSFRGGVVATIVGGRLLYLHPDHQRVSEGKSEAP